LAAVNAAATGMTAAAKDAVPIPRPRPAIAIKLSQSTASAYQDPARTETANPLREINTPAGTPAELRRPLILKSFRDNPQRFAAATTATSSDADIAGVQRVLDFSRKSKDADALAAMQAIRDPLARKLAEYLYLHNNNTNPSFEQFASFVTTNPSWPHIPLLTRRAENALWDDKRDDATVRAFFANRQPTSGKGRLTLARALLAQGDRASAQALVRHAWRYDEMSAEVESRALDMFGALLTAEDHKARMNIRLYDGDTEAGLRAAQRLGSAEVLIARARIAAAKRGGNAKAALDAVPASARHDAGYLFARAQYLRKQDEIADAARLMLSAPTDAAHVYDPNRWWVERRLLIRNVLDAGDAKTAYRLAVNAPAPTQGNYRVDQHFTAGWLALRFLNDPATAAKHFARIPVGTDNPHALSRAGYWEGRAAEAMGQRARAKAFYEQAAVHSATYYGQLARAKLGLPEVGLRPPPRFTAQERAANNRLEVVRAVDILYALNERDIIASIMAELGGRTTDANGLAALGDLAERHKDGRALVLLGKAAHGRGLPFEHYAFPTVGLPAYSNVGPAVEPAVTYSIARQESHFNQKVVSPANAMGFMQVTPAAGQYIAKKFKVVYDKMRLLKDPVYNMQMGAAELGNLLNIYRGSYIMTFAGYNAGQGRVRQWIAAYGDPRDPNVDPVDWVERIPIAETRNYVPRILENLQVYRVRFGGSSRLQIEADLRRGGE
jgi:soluble lytic murein transglycosylase